MFKKSLRTGLVLAAALLVLSATTARAQYLMENLGRGVVAVRQNATDVYVGWRLSGTDPADVAFNLYRSTGGGPEVQLNPSPITDSTNFVDTTADLSQPNAYFVRAVVNGVEGAPSAAFTLPANAPEQQYLNVPLQIPPGGTTPAGQSYTYNANDASVGDVDGDGEYEIILKWDPSNSKDNSQSGHTGNVYLDAYKLDGTRLWRIDLGINIRAGAHYTQFMVYDLDGDGRAEVACKTAPGTVDGAGNYVLLAGDDPAADYRNSNGYVLTGPEYLTVFNGLTGAAMATVPYNPARGNVSDWGDDYGNRVDRFLAGVAYLDGQRPSLIMSRGYYTRAHVAAWDFRGGKLTNRWNFDTGFSGGPYAFWRGQGAHSLTIGDVDGDGRDEITFGAAAIDDDGSGLYTTRLGHGDALHLSDMDPDRPGQEVWMVHESPSEYGANGSEFRDAKTGQLILGVSGGGDDVGRGVAFDVDPNHRGYEMWSSRSGLMSSKGYQISTARPGTMNFGVWWDADLLRELEDGTSIRKWDWTTSTQNVIFAPADIASNNSTKATPALLGDILGDWREEVVWRTSDNTALRIYTTNIPTSHRIYTLMHDHQYRVAVAWQNTAYNQPPHPSFFIGEGMSAPPRPNIVTSSAELPAVAPAVISSNRFDPYLEKTGATSVTFRVTFNTQVTGVDASDFALATTGGVTGTVSGVTAQSALAYNVTVSSLVGSGNVRLDLKPSGTGISSTAGVPISGGFTSGQTYSRATLAWINAVTGGLWSGETNWDGRVVADGLDSVPVFGNFDLTANNTVFLDTPRTLSGMTFGDANTASAASWTISDGNNPENVLTLDTTSGVPAVTVNALGTGATATLGAAVAGTKGFAKAGAGTLLLGRENVFTGTLNVNGGTLRIPAGGAVNNGGGTAAVSSGTQLNVAGGSLTVGGLLTSSGGSVVIDGGSAALNAGFRTNSDFGSTLRVNNGTLTTPDVNIRRNGGAANDFTSGFLVKGGVANVGTIWLGNNNSTGAMSVEGGSLTATGAVTVGNNSGSTRGGGIQVLGGQFTSTDTASGVVLTRASGNVTTAVFNGGVSTVEKFTFGFNSAVTSGSGTLTLNGGTLYVGAGGMVRNGTGSYTSPINLTSGTLGAKADWSSAMPMTLGASGVTLRAADGAGSPFNITLNGALTGAGGFNKTGGGTLTLAGANTYTGATTVSAGTLRVDGSVAPGAGAFNVSGGTVAGSGSVNRAVTLGSGGTVAPGVGVQTATLSAASLTWNGGGKLSFDLAGASDRLSLSGALTKGAAGTYQFVFNVGAGLVPGATYTLVTFGSTNFGVADFSHSGLPSGLKGKFTLEAGALKFTVSDGDAPVLQAPADIVLEANGPGGAVATYTATATDAVEGPVNVTFSIPSGSTFPVGTTQVTATAADSAGNTANATFNVTVRDTSGPALTLPADIVLEADSAAGSVATFTASAVDAVGGAAQVSLSAQSGATFPLGTTTVNASATDAAGNTSTGSFNVTVRDTTAPALNAPPDITLEATGPGGAAATFEASAADAVSGQLNVTFSTPSGSTFPVGTTQVTAIATDAAGNAATKTFTVTVRDTTAPVIAPVADIELEATSAAGAAADYAATASDIVDGSVSVSFSAPSGSSFALGTTAVTVTAADAAGNTATRTFNVTVRDTTKPALTPPASQTLEATSAAGAAATYTATAADIVSGNLPVTFSPPSGSTFPLGTTQVTAAATDAAGNTSAATFTVTVVDTTAPALTLPATIVKEATSAAGANVSFTASAADAVSGSLAVTCTPASGGLFAAGQTSVNCSATDAAGHTTSGSFLVYVTAFGTAEEAAPVAAATDAAPVPLTVTAATGEQLSLSVDFGAVTTAGVVTVRPVADPAEVGTAAPDFSISNLVAYEVGTTAAFGGPVTLGFKVPGPISEEEFNRLAVLHGVNGALVDITAAAPPRDYSTLTVYATTNTLGSFYLAKRATQKVQALFDQTKAFKAGSTVPVKVRLVDASSGANVSSSSTPLAARGLRLVGAATSLSVQDAGQANPDGGFRFAEGTDGGSYVFNLSTKGLAPGRYTLSVYAGGDRSFFHTVYFEVK